MTLYSLFGNPVSHSLSPRMHNLAFARLGIDGAYIRTPLEDGSKLKEVFFLQALDGGNVTVPHKQDAFLACDEVRGLALTIGAVNTLVREEGKLIGYNTDAHGFLRAIGSFGELQSALILGAGGTARAIAHALRASGVRVTLLNRSEGNLLPFIEEGFSCFTHATFHPTPYDLIVNTTSAGLKEELLPAPSSLLEPLLKTASYAFDVIYNAQTPFLTLARACGLTCKDGKEMLLWQGVLAFNLFHHNTLNETVIALAMEEALKLSS